jgi:hypothetical protein
MKKLLVALVLFAVAAFADLTGTWNVEVETDAGAGSPTLVLKQDGEKITGTYAGALGEAKVNGTLKGDQVEITFEVEQGGQGGKVIYKGTVKGDTMSGTVDLAGMAKGTFKAKKK